MSDSFTISAANAIPNTPDAVAEQSVDVIGNIEALLRDDYDDDDGGHGGSGANGSGGRSAMTVVDNQHFFVVSTPQTPLNPKLAALNSNMNCAAAPFQPRLGGSGAAAEGLFSAAQPSSSAAGSNVSAASFVPPLLQQQMMMQHHHHSAMQQYGGGHHQPTFTPYAPSGHMHGLTTPPRTSTLRGGGSGEHVKAGFIGFDALKAHTTTHFGIIVNNLDPRTQSKHLMSIFFPLGAVDAQAFQSPVGNEAMGLQFAGRKGGVVMFTSSEMAMMAAAKLDDFVPHGQTLPLHTTYFGRFEDYVAIKDTFVMERPPLVSANGAEDSVAQQRTALVDQQQQQEEAAAAASSAAMSGPSSPSSSDGTHRFITTLLDAAATSPEACDKAVDALVAGLARDPARRTPIIITVCAAVNSKQQGSAEDAAMYPHAPHFLRGMSRFVIQSGLMDLSTPRAVKLACGTICGAMFALQIVRGNPYGMALRIATEHLRLSPLMATDADNGGSDAAAPLPPLDEAQVNTLDALVAMGRSWFGRLSAEEQQAYAKVDAEAQFEGVVERLVAEGRYTIHATSTAAAEVTVTTPTTATPAAALDGVEPATPTAPSTPAALPAEASVNTTVNAADEAGDAGGVNTSAISVAVSTSSFQVSATPIRSTAAAAAQPSGHNMSTFTVSSSSSHHHNHHNVSVDSTVSSVGPRYSTSTAQTPEKRTVVMGDGTACSSLNTSGVTATTAMMSTRKIPMVGHLSQSHHHANPNMMMSALMSPCPANGGIGSGVNPSAAPFSMTLLGALEGSNLRQHLMASTVYMTKVPCTLQHATLRRLFECFGEFNKVRIYEEKRAAAVGGNPKAVAPPLSSSAAGGVPPTAFNNRGNFGFVEFVIPASSKAMVDFFRNPTSSVQQRMGISREELEAILTMRVSYARSCIHDHDADDAVFDMGDVGSHCDVDSPGRKVKDCTFGLDGAQHNTSIMMM